MNFTTDKPIYVQILDYCMDQISNEVWVTGGRIPSVKELCVALCVNPRTVMRAYEEMADKSIIFSQRGMGYYVAPEGREIVDRIRADNFRQVILPEFIAQMRRAKISREEVIRLLQETR